MDPVYIQDFTLTPTQAAALAQSIEADLSSRHLCGGVIVGYGGGQMAMTKRATQSLGAATMWEAHMVGVVMDRLAQIAREVNES